MSKESPPPQLNRILSLDFLRGAAILMVLIFHSIIFIGFNDVGSAQETVPVGIQILLLPFIILGSWASFFALISGASLTFSVYQRIVKKGKSVAGALKQSINRTLIMILLHFIYTYFFIHPSTNIYGDTSQSLVPGTINNGSLFIPDISIVLVASAFIMLAFSNLLVTVCLLFIWRKDRCRNTRSIYIIMGIIGSLFFLFSPALSRELTPLMFESFAEGDFIRGTFLTWVVGLNHSIFPFVGYAFFGALFGLALAENRPFYTIKYWGVRLATIALILAFIALIRDGLPTFPITTQPFSIYAMNLGLQILAVMWISGKLDYSSPEEQVIFAEKTVGIRRWGFLSLTIFLVESTTSSLFAYITRAFLPFLLENLILTIIVWAPIYTYLFWRFAIYWEKKNFKFSLEWLIERMKSTAKNIKNLDLLQIKKKLYGEKIKESDDLAVTDSVEPENACDFAEELSNDESKFEKKD